jgi:hypothetical protein
MSGSDKFEQIIAILHEINVKLDKLLPQEISNNGSDNSLFESLDVMTLLSLPDHLRTTATTLVELQSATANDVAKMTHKERAVESNYLNQLSRMGHVNKYRKGRKVYFSVSERSGN